MRDKSYFDEFYTQYSIESTRKGLTIGILMYMIFGVLDYFVAPMSYKLIWIIRFGITTPIIVTALLLSYTNFFLKRQNLLMVPSLVVPCSILAMLYITEDEELASQVYYVGLILCLIGTNSLLRLRIELSIITVVIVIIGYEISAWFHQKLYENIPVFINNTFSLVSASLMGLFAAYSREKMARSVFENRELLKGEKEELNNSKQELMASNAFKNKLLSIISHDIKGPLASTRGLLILCNNDLISKKEFQENSKKLISILDGTSNLLENLLSWSSGDGDNTSRQGDFLSVKEAVKEVFQLLEEQAKVKKNQLINTIDSDLSIHTNPVVFKLIVRNLISNANKFTENGSISVKSDRINGRFLKVSVSDTGVGIPKDVVPRLFDWNQKHSTLGTRNEKGTGIGLLICKECTESLGGHLDLETELGIGTTFSITIPRELN